MAAAITAKTPEEMEQKLENGLVKGHAYGITAVKRITTGDTSIFNFWSREKIGQCREFSEPVYEVDRRIQFNLSVSCLTLCRFYCLSVSL